MRITLLLALLSTLAFAQLPNSYLIKMDPNYSKNVIIVEKSTHKLFIYNFNDGVISLVKTFSIASGKNTGNKLRAGDKKTPEGIYFLQRFFSDKNLLKRYGNTALIYGAGAFTLDYPNQFDRLSKKTGSGIWLHSTDDDNRISKGLDSKGCVVATDKDIRAISKYINLKRTPIIITNDMSYLSQEAWDLNKIKLESFFKSWSQAWKEKNFNSYISHYSKSHFYDKKKGRYSSFKKYKSYIFKRKDTPEIEFSDISILKFKNTAVISATQRYQSNSINDIGRKKIYLQQNDKYEWKIIKESWEKVEPQTETNFFEEMPSATEQK